MTLDQLEAIQAIVDHGSFRAAAEHLHRSQPALSTSVKNLEEEFGLQLFDRKEYRPKLTEAGAVFLHSARATLQAAHYTSRVAQELGQKRAETKLRIAVDPLVPAQHIAAMARECAKPTVPVALIVEKTLLHNFREDLLAGRVDLALAPVPENSAGLEFTPLETVHLVGAIAKKLVRRPLNQAFLQEITQVVVYDKPVAGAEAENETVLAGKGPKVLVPDHFTKVKLIEGGVGWGLICDAELAASKNLVALDRRLCGGIALKMGLIRARDRALGPVARKIWEEFRK